MFLEESPEQQQLRAELRRYYAEILTDDIRARLAASGEGGEAWGEVVRRVGKDGWLGIGWPTEFGGQGRPATDQFIFFDETRRAGAPFPFVTINTVGPTIMRYGTEAQKAFFLPQILAGELNFAIGYTEPEAGTDLASLRTRAVRDGEEYVINGGKIFTSGANEADYIWLAVRTDPDVPKHKGMSALLVDMKAPGVTVRPLKQITGDSEFNEIFFEDVRVPKENLLGPINMGWQVLVSTLMHERFGIGETLGGTEQLLHQLVQIAKSVQLNGRPAIEDNDIRQQIAQFAIEATAKKYNGLRSLSKRLKGQQPGPEASISKLLSTDLGQRMTKFITRLLGEYALLERHTPFAPEGDWMRRILSSESMTIAGGTSPVQKNMIGERILQLPKG
jgi:hypothetical protein